MNFRHGFRRLFVAFAVSWYVLGALFLYVAWTSHYSSQRSNLERCLDAARQDNEKLQDTRRAAPPKGPGAKSQLKPPPNALYDVHGNLVPESQPKLPEGWTLVQPG